MKDDRDPLGLDRCPKRAEERLVEVEPVDRAPDLEAPESQFIDSPVHLTNGQVHILKGDGGAERHEPIRVRGRGRRHVVVLDAGRLRGELGGRPVVILGDEGGETLHVHAHAVHVLETRRRVGELFDDPGVHHLVVIPGVLAHVEVVGLVLWLPMCLDGASAGRGGEVAVDVDRGHQGRGTLTGKERSVA